MSVTEAQPVVIAYDGSAVAGAAIARGGELLGRRPAVVVSVWAPIGHAAPAATIGAPRGVAVAGARGLDAAEREKAARLAAAGAELARRAGFTAEPLAIRHEGAPWRAIVDCAAELDAAAVVAGTRGRSLPVAAILGSTAEGVLHHAHRPVLLVPGA
jgi:nucleotide-binding universal stress UspA family protein